MLCCEMTVLLTVQQQLALKRRLSETYLSFWYGRKAPNWRMKFIQSSKKMEGHYSSAVTRSALVLHAVMVPIEIHICQCYCIHNAS